MRDERPLPEWAWGLLREVALGHGVRVEDVTGPRRMPRLVEARKDLASRGRARGLSLADIGCLLNRDHTTVLHYLRKEENDG